MYLLHRRGGYFTSVLFLWTLYLLNSDKFLPSISSVSLTFSEVALTFGKPIDHCGEPCFSFLGFSLCQNIDEIME